MSRKMWFALALAAVLAVSYAAGSVAATPRGATDIRSAKITKGLDYLHAQQTDEGGFGSMANTAWAILGQWPAANVWGATPGRSTTRPP